MYSPMLVNSYAVLPVAFEEAPRSGSEFYKIKRSGRFLSSVLLNTGLSDVRSLGVGGDGESLMCTARRGIGASRCQTSTKAPRVR